MIDYYFRKPLLWDYALAIGTTLCTFILFRNNYFKLPKDSDSYSLTGDLTNISLTLAGFILTILTVLITFKDNSSDQVPDNASVFRKFFNTPFYYETVKHLKNCIKSILVVSVIGFFIKLFIPEEHRKYFFYYNVTGIIITILTIWRCLIIIGKILVLQKEELNN